MLLESVIKVMGSVVKAKGLRHNANVAERHCTGVRSREANSARLPGPSIVRDEWQNSNNPAQQQKGVSGFLDDTQTMTTDGI